MGETGARDRGKVTDSLEQKKCLNFDFFFPSSFLLLFFQFAFVQILHKFADNYEKIFCKSFGIVASRHNKNLFLVTAAEKAH